MLTGSIRLPERSDGEPVDARKHAAVAPLLARAAERSAKNLAFGLQPDQGRADRRRVDREPRRKIGFAHRPARFEPAAQYLRQRFLARRRGARGLHGGRRRRDGRVRIDGGGEGEPFGARPSLHAVDRQRGRPALRRQFIEPFLPCRVGRNRDERQQGVVQFVGTADERPRPLGDLLDRARIEDARRVGAGVTPKRYRPRPPLFQGRVIEERVWASVEQLMAEDRRLRRIDGFGRYLTALDGAQNGPQAIEVHCFVQTVVDRLAHEHVIGHANRSGEVLAASRRVGEARRKQIVRAHALNLRRDFLARAHAQDRQRAGGVPAPARSEHRRGEERLGQDGFDACGLDVFEDDVERKCMLLRQRENDPVVVCRRLQFDVERAAELFSQRESPRAIDAGAQRRVQDQLHAARLIEEALGDQRDGGRDGTQHRFAGSHVRDGLLRGSAREAAAFLKPCKRGRVVSLIDGRAHGGDLVRELDRSSEPFAVPKRDRRRCAVRILDANRPGFDAPDHPRRRPQQEDVAGHAFDGEVLVDRADDVPSGSATTL